MISNLPQGLITEILARLPVKSVVRCLCVSKEWYALITGSDFIKLHLKVSIETNRDRTLIFNEDDLFPHVHDFSAVQFSKYNRFGKGVQFYQPLENWVISDYCDGLVCLHKDHEKQEVAIWNPLVRKYRKFPFEPIEGPSGFSSCIWFSHLAFGRDPCNNDYKVLRVTEFYMTGRIEFEVKVCSMRSRSWKKIDEQWPDMEITWQNLIWYDIEKKRCYRVKNRNFRYEFKVATCVGSLLLLDGDNVIDPKQKKNKRKRKRKR